MSRPEAAPANPWTALWQRFWTLPAAIAATSVLLGLVLPQVDQALGGEAPVWLFQGGVDGARSLLSAIAGAMISVTGLVFSITIVTLQLASSQFSPRVLGAFLDSRVVQVTLGVFTGSFLYALVVLRAVRGGEAVVVPHLSVTGSVLYVVAAVAMFLAFIHHITESVRVTAVMRRVRDTTVQTLHRMTGEDHHPPHAWSPRPGTPSTEIAMDDRAGYVTVVDCGRLASLAAEHDLVVVLDVTPGDFLGPRQVIGRALGHDSVPEAVLRRLTQCLHVADERSMYQDTAFGVRQLLDIAERALSPAVNDPTTAIQALNEISVILRMMAERPDASPYLVHGDEIRASYQAQTFAAVLETVVDELMHHGADSLRIPVRLLEVLDAVAAGARPEHQATIQAQRTKIDVGPRDDAVGEPPAARGHFKAGER